MKRKKPRLKKLTKKEITEEITKKLKKKGLGISGKNNIVSLKSRKDLIKKNRANTKERLAKLEKRKTDNGRILAIDMSKSKPGFCIVDKKGKILIAVSYPGSGKNQALELLNYTRFLIKQYKPEMVVFEDTFLKFKRAAAVLSFYQGLIYGNCIKAGIPVFKVSNLVVKKFFEAETKEQIFENINNLYKMDLDFNEFNDEVDAIGLALFSLHSPEKLKTL